MERPILFPRCHAITRSPAGPLAGGGGEEAAHCDDDRKMYLQAAIVRIMKQRKVGPSARTATY